MGLGVRRVVAVVAVLAVLTPGCASTADPDSEAASRSGCEWQTVEDEYGLEVEIELCDGETFTGDSEPVATEVPAAATPGVLAEPTELPLVGGPAPKSTFAIEQDALDTRDSTALADWFADALLRPCAVETGTEPPPLAGYVPAGATAALVATKNACADPGAFAQAHQALVGEAVDLTASIMNLNANVEATLRAPAADSALVATAAAATEWLAWALDGGRGPRTHSNPLFWNFAARGHQLEVMANGVPRVVILGNSQAQFGIDPLPHGPDAFNYAIPGASISVGLITAQGLFAQESFTPGDVEHLVVGVSAIALMGASERTCLADQGIRFGRSIEVQQQMFANSPVNERFAAVFGNPAFASILDATPMAVEYPVAHAAQGRFEDYPELNEAAQERRLQVRRDVFTNWVECTARLDTLDQLIELGVSQGATVHVVLLPVRSDLMDLAPDGPSSIVALNETVTSRVQAAGARVIDASMIGDAGMLDVVHVGPAGRDQISAVIGDAFS